MAYEYNDIPDDEKAILREKPDYVLEYIAPMACGDPVNPSVYRL